MALSTLRRIFKQHPLLANVVSVTSAMATADLTCQLVENGLSNFDITRWKTMTTMGAIYHGPTFYYFYRFLDRAFPGKNARAVFTKLAVNVAFNAPFTVGFYSVMGVLERKSSDEIVKEVKLKTLPTYLSSCTFWPAAHLIGFSFVPPVYRVLYISCGTFVWLTFLSYVKNRPTLPTVLQSIEDLTVRKVQFN